MTCLDHPITSDSEFEDELSLDILGETGIHQLFGPLIRVTGGDVVSQGAAPAVWAAVARELEGKEGLYLENCAVAVKAAEGLDELGEDRLQYGYATWAYDEAGENKLWEMSLKMTGLKGKE